MTRFSNLWVVLSVLICCFAFQPSSVSEELSSEECASTLIGDKDLVYEFDLDERLEVPIPDQETYAQGYYVKLSNLLASFEFESLKITPSFKEGVAMAKVKVGVNDVKIDIPNIYLYRRRPIYCYHSHIYIGYYQPVYFRANLFLSFEGGELIITATDTSFDIHPNNYQTYGPASCRGVVFNRPIVRKAIAKQIRSFRSTLESVVEERVLKLVPEYLRHVYESELNP